VQKRLKDAVPFADLKASAGQYRPRGEKKSLTTTTEEGGTSFPCTRKAAEDRSEKKVSRREVGEREGGVESHPRKKIELLTLGKAVPHVINLSSKDFLAALENEPNSSRGKGGPSLTTKPRPHEPQKKGGGGG